MHHGHVLKKLNFELLTQTPVSGGGTGEGLEAKHLVPCCCIRDSLLFDMQHDHVLKQWNSDLLTPSPGSGRWGEGKIFATMMLYFVIPFNFICNMTML